jgi:hypothetical protein
MSAGQTAQLVIGRHEEALRFRYPLGPVGTRLVSNVTVRKRKLQVETLVRARYVTYLIVRGEIPTGQKRTQLTSAIQNILRVEN